MIFKNVINQGLYVMAIDKTTGAGQTGDAANITATWSKDGAASAALTDVNPTEIGAGVYHFDITQAESDCARFSLTPSSTTLNVLVSPVFGFTQSGAIPTAAPGANGGLPTVDANNRIAGMQGTINNLNNLDAAITTRSSHDANAVRDAIFNRVLNGNHDTAGTAGKLLQFLDAAITGIPTAAQNRSEMDANSIQLAAILEDTGTTLPATLAAIVGYIDTEIAAIKAVTDLLPDGGALTALSGEASTAVQQLTHASHGLAALRVFLARVDALIEDVSGDQFTTKALSQAPSGGGGGGDATLANQTAILAAIAALNVGGGSGANPVTVTVTDGTDPQQNAKVLILDGATILGFGLTDPSGNFTFSLDNGTVTVSATKAGHTFSPITRTVTGPETGTLVDTDVVLTPVTVPGPPADPNDCTVAGYLRALDGIGIEKVSVTFKLNVTNGGDIKDGTGRIIAKREFKVPVDSSGNLDQVDLPRNDLAIPNDSNYLLTCRELGWADLPVTLNASTFDIGTLVS